MTPMTYSPRNPNSGAHETLAQGSLAVEQRKATRVTQTLPVQYRIRNKSNWEKGQSIELSQSGIRLLLTSPIRVGTPMDLEIHMPKQEEPLRLSGVVIWNMLVLQQEGIFECGVSFRIPEHPSKERLIRFMADCLCDFALQHSSDFIVEPAQTRQEIDCSFHLLYKEYIARGYCPPNDHQLQYNFHALLPGSSILLLKEKGVILGTMTLITDSPCGLPMESLFPEEIAALRKQGRKLGELGLLTLNSEMFQHKSFSLTSFKKQKAVFLLFKGMIYYSYLVAGVTDHVFGVHPKHQMLYHYIASQSLAGPKPYPGACGNLAHPFRLDLKKGFEGGFDESQFWRTLLSNPPSAHHFTNRYPWKSEDVREFLLTKQSLWSKLPPNVQQHFIDCYPGLIK